MKFCDEVRQVWRRSFQSLDAQFFCEKLANHDQKKGFWCAKSERRKLQVLWLIVAHLWLFHVANAFWFGEKGLVETRGSFSESRGS